MRRRRHSSRKEWQEVNLGKKTSGGGDERTDRAAEVVDFGEIEPKRFGDPAGEVVLGLP